MDEIEIDLDGKKREKYNVDSELFYQNLIEKIEEKEKQGIHNFKAILIIDEIAKRFIKTSNKSTFINDQYNNNINEYGNACYCNKLCRQKREAAVSR